MKYMPHFYEFMICLPPSLALLRQAVFSECRCLVFTYRNTYRSEWFTCSCHLKQTSFICNYVLLLANKILKQEKKKNVSVGMKRLRYLYFTLQNVKLKLPCTVCLFHSAVSSWADEWVARSGFSASVVDAADPISFWNGKHYSSFSLSKNA